MATAKAGPGSRSIQKRVNLGGGLFAQELRAAARQAAKIEMVKGALWFAVGAAISGITYAAAAPGGRYLLFWGPIAYGGYRLVRAIYFWLNPEALLRKD